MERTPAATEGPAELLDRLLALAELLEVIFPNPELGLTGMMRHRVDSPANCRAKVQQRKKPTTQFTIRRRKPRPAYVRFLCCRAIQKSAKHRNEFLSAIGREATLH
jgi:hypothetical protein